MTLSGGPDSNSNEQVLHIPKISKAEASPSDSVVSYQDIRWGDLALLQRGSRCIL